MTDEKKVSTLKPIKNFFGFKDGQTMTQFGTEFKALTDEDKKQLADGIENGSLTY